MRIDSMTTHAVKPGNWVEHTMAWEELDFDKINMRISTDRYTSREYAGRERELIWSRVWQVAGRVDELPANGDWKEYRIYDQSYVVVRGNDGIHGGIK